MNEFITAFPETESMPMLALRGLSVFPKMLLNFDVERKQSLAALDAASAGDRRIFLLTQKEIGKENPGRADLYTIGTICYLKQILKLPGGGSKVLVEGLGRGELINILSDRKFFFSEVRPIQTEPAPKMTPRIEALIRKTMGLFDAYALTSGHIAREVVLNVFSMTAPGEIADFIAQQMILRSSKKQRILETLNPVKRLELICDMLANELEVLSIERSIDEKLRLRLEDQQREHVLREQLRIIQSELGETSTAMSDTAAYRERILALSLPEETEEKLLREVARLEKQQHGSSESSVIRNYLDVCLDLPWNKTTKERLDVAGARKILDADHFGLEKVKARIIEFLAVKQLAPKSTGTILCLVGPPGVGKTSIAISIARALNRKLARLSLGGVHDEAEIRGHRKTYVGAMPGRIINAISQAGSSNPLLLLDEIDKLGRDYRGDPASALLEVLDPEQNATFRDHYLEVPYDLSNVMFITTANQTSTIPRPLLDRMEVIELTSYTDMEKLEIAKRHLLPKQRKKHGLKAANLRISDATLLEIIYSYTKESGVRRLERELASVCRKAAAGIVSDDWKSLRLTSTNLEDVLGPRKYMPEKLSARDEIGLVKGLAWTAAGGEILDVEVNVLEGTGKLELTGNLGDVMKESARAAVSYIRSRVTKLGIDPAFHTNRDIHIHFPEGAVPKDGPSAGITIAIAVISALTGAPVRRDLAMTGEITLRGRILRIGGLKEKTMAALRSGVKTVIIPAENEADLEEIDQTVRQALNFITAGHIDGILDVALDFDSAAKPPSAEPSRPLMLDEGSKPSEHPATLRQ